MGDSLDHLPRHKQQELAQVVEVIRSASDDIEMVILFGSYARGDSPDEHFLGLLERWAARHHTPLPQAFPRQTEEDRARFAD